LACIASDSDDPMLFIYNINFSHIQPTSPKSLAATNRVTEQLVGNS